MRRLHYSSGLIITLFVVVHLFNHVYSLFGAHAHIRLMEALREVYRHPVAELVLFIAIGLQLVSGLKLAFKKRKSVTLFFEKLQIWTGVYLAVFLLIHLSAVVSGRFVLNLDTNFYFGVAGLNTWPLNLFFGPYYGLAIMSFFGHIAAVHSKKMKQPLLGLSPHQQSYGILLLGAMLTLVVFYGLTNGFQGVDLPEAYRVMVGG